MKIKKNSHGIFIKIFLAILFFGVFIFFVWPSFEKPDFYGDMKYGQLREKLGTPNGELDGKYVLWRKELFFSGWILRADFEEVPQRESCPTAVNRYFWIGIINHSFNIFNSSFENDKNCTALKIKNS